jgi:hypothetical protein
MLATFAECRACYERESQCFWEGFEDLRHACYVTSAAGLVSTQLGHSPLQRTIPKAAIRLARQSDSFAPYPDSGCRVTGKLVTLPATICSLFMASTLQPILDE